MVKCVLKKLINRFNHWGVDKLMVKNTMMLWPFSTEKKLLERLDLAILDIINYPQKIQ